jgi:hypothetical protein
MAAPILDQDLSDAQHENLNEGYVTPLPWGQILILLLIQFAEPMTAVISLYQSVRS